MQKYEDGETVHNTRVNDEETLLDCVRDSQLLLLMRLAEIGRVKCHET